MCKQQFFGFTGLTLILVFDLKWFSLSSHVKLVRILRICCTNSHKYLLSSSQA